MELKAYKEAETAIRQLKERRYAGALQHYKGAIILAGINYGKASKKHTCLIEKIQGQQTWYESFYFIECAKEENVCRR